MSHRPIPIEERFWSKVERSDERAAIAWLDQFTPTAGWRHQVHTIKRMLADRERLRAALRAVRACTDPQWQAQLIKDALREDQP
jgi:hypothetical protein